MRDRRPRADRDRDLQTVSDFLDWTKAVHGGGVTADFHHKLVSSERPFPTVDEARAALDRVRKAL